MRQIIGQHRASLCIEFTPLPPLFPHPWEVAPLSALRSMQWPEHPHLRELSRRSRNGEEEAVQFRAEQGGPRAAGGRHMRHTTIGAALLREHVSENIHAYDIGGGNACSDGQEVA